MATSNKKIARRQVIRENGKLRVVYVDVATGQIVTDLSGYEISSSDIGSNPVDTTKTPPTQEEPKPTTKGDGSSYTAAEPFNWQGFASRPGASRGSGNIVDDIGKTFGGAVQGAIGIVDKLTGRSPSWSPSSSSSSDNALNTYRNTTGSGSTAFSAPPSVDNSGVPSIPNHTTNVVALLKDIDMGGVSENNWKVDLNPLQVKALITQIAGTHMISDAGTAAMLAHAEHESGFNPNVKPGDNGKAFGIFQWNDRADAMKDWTTSKYGVGADKYAYPQIMFAMHELQTTETRALSVLTDAATPAQANFGMALFERYAGSFDRDGNYLEDGKENQERLKATDKYYTALINGDNTFGDNPGKVVQNDLPGLAASGALQLSGPNTNKDVDQSPLGNQIPPDVLKAIQNLRTSAGDTTPMPAMSGNPVNMNGIPVDPTAIAKPNWNPLTDEIKANIKPGVDPLPSGVGLNPTDLALAEKNYQQNYANHVASKQPENPQGVNFGVGTDPAVTNTGAFTPTPMGEAIKDAYLATINKSLGSPQFNTTFDGRTIEDTSVHPNSKVFLDNGKDSTTAAGYGGLPFGLYTEYAYKTGVNDFSLASQKKVMWQIASDNYRQNTGNDLLLDLMSGNKDKISSAIVNNSNIWKTLPGGSSSSTKLPDLVGTFTNITKRAAEPGVQSEITNTGAFSTAPISAATKLSFADVTPDQVYSKVDEYRAKNAGSTSSGNYALDNYVNAQKAAIQPQTGAPKTTPAPSQSSGGNNSTYDGAYSPSDSSSNALSNYTKTTTPSKSVASVPGTGSYTAATKGSTASKPSAPSVPGGIGTYTAATKPSSSTAFATKPGSTSSSDNALNNYLKSTR